MAFSLRERFSSNYWDGPQACELLNWLESSKIDSEGNCVPVPSQFAAACAVGVMG